jgi:hypothetical protein
VITSQEKFTLMELAMQKFVGTILVIVVCLAVFASPVTAGDVLGPGDIAIIGYNFDNDDEFAFVCLKEVSAGTEIRFTDQGWKTDNTFLDFDNDGPLSWQAPSTGCKLGEIVKIRVLDYYTNMSLNSNGDQIIVHQQLETGTNLIYALNAAGPNWMAEATNETNSSIPSALSSLTPSPLISITSYDNAIYKGTKSFDTTTDALAAIGNIDNWTGDNSVRQTMPSGSFSFTTTAVHLSEFSAETEGETAPWWIIAGLVVIPVLVMGFKKPKRECCK